jgi:hypothetical protein
MRARLMMKLMALIVMLVLSVITARSCSSSPASSPENPATLAHNALSGLCANQAAAAQASGDTSAQTLMIPQSQDNLGNMAQSVGMNPGSFSCPTTTTTGVGSP